MTVHGVRLETATASATFDPVKGGRLASLVVGGMELLVGPDADPMRWGAYPMVPWSGRIRYGRFRFDGVDHQLPITLGPHAIHGTAYTSSWTVDDGCPDGELRMMAPLGDPWPFPATVEHLAELRDGGLTMTLRLTADERSMPAMVGWHPWFRRVVDGSEADLRFAATSMYDLDDEMIPTGRLVAPCPPPWDNCFTGLESDPTIVWPDRLQLQLSSSADYWTIYTEPEHALCVEPQTDPPDAVNRVPTVIQAGETMTSTFDLRWELS